MDASKKLLRDLKEAVRSETAKDDQGREYRVNAAVTFVGEDGIQESLYGNIDAPTTPHDFVVEYFEQSRKGIADTCYRLKIKVDHYTDAHPDRVPYQLILDFAEDVAEREVLGEPVAEPREDEDDEDDEDIASAAEEE